MATMARVLRARQQHRRGTPAGRPRDRRRDLVHPESDRRTSRRHLTPVAARQPSARPSRGRRRSRGRRSLPVRARRLSAAVGWAPAGTHRRPQPAAGPRSSCGSTRSRSTCRSRSGGTGRSARTRPAPPATGPSRSAQSRASPPPAQRQQAVEDRRGLLQPLRVRPNGRAQRRSASRSQPPRQNDALSNHLRVAALGGMPRRRFLRLQMGRPRKSG